MNCPRCGVKMVKDYDGIVVCPNCDFTVDKGN